MSKPVIFRRGNLEDFGMPVDEFISSDDSSLYFVEDEFSLYKSVGNGKKLVKFSDVLSGFENGDDLITKVPQGIKNKLYLTDNGNIYYYANDEWHTITAEADLDTFPSEKVTFDNSDTSLLSTNIKNAIKELDDKLEDLDMS